MDFLRSSIEYALGKRLEEIIKVRAALCNIEDTLPDRFLRGPVQLQILELAGMQKTGLNKRLVNETLENYGFKKIKIHGRLFFKRIK